MKQNFREEDVVAIRNSVQSRISKIREYGRNNETLNLAAEARQQAAVPKLIGKIQELTPRIEMLITTYNLAVSNKLPIVEDEWSVKSHSQRIGFFDSGTEEILYMGLSLARSEQVYSAGNEEFVLCTNGLETFCALPHYMDEVKIPAVIYMERFLQEFEAFENRFYIEVDNILKGQEENFYEHANLVDDILAGAVAKSKGDMSTFRETKECSYSM